MISTKDAIINHAKTLSCDDQHDVATQLAANVGYKLVPEDSIQDAEARHDVLERLARLEGAVMELNPGLNW